MTAALMPVIFDAPLVTPSPSGLYAATTWAEETGPTRFLGSGVQIRPWNYGGEGAFGIWTAPWCGELTSDDDALKTGVRPDPETTPFDPITVWAYDECDLTAASRAEVQTRVQQVLRLQEQTGVEEGVAARLLVDATTIASRPTLSEAVGYLEGEMSKTNTLGAVHAGAQWASLAGEDLIVNSGGAMRTRLGHRWVFGGGYVDVLGDVLIATSPMFGWRDSVQVRTTIKESQNLFAAVAERTVVVGYEQLVAAVSVDDGSV